jgi:hypothetical protein
VVAFDVVLSEALRESNVHRRRPGEERKDGEVLKTNRLPGSRYCRYDIYGMGQRLRNGWLNDDMGSMAKGTIGMNCLAVDMGMPNLHNGGTNDKCAAEETKGHPERTMRPLIGAAT